MIFYIIKSINFMKEEIKKLIKQTFILIIYTFIFEIPFEI